MVWKGVPSKSMTNYKWAVSMNWRSFLVGVFETRALLFWGYVKGPEFWKLPVTL